MVSVPATRSAHPGFESWPGASPHGRQIALRILYTSTNKVNKTTRLRLAVSKTKEINVKIIRKLVYCTVSSACNTFVKWTNTVMVRT